jgi:prepilin-type N-terminal cleavage/methylation domain-containing protein
MKNERGFTLIELLAVITIMGILMMVAIPTISRTIENSRKDTFIDMVKNYSSAARTMWTGDNLMCDGVVSSAVPLGVYYIEINTMSDSVPVLLEQGGKSPWGNRDVLGVIVVGVRDRNNSRHVSFYPAITDGVHGVNIKSDGSTVVSSLKADNKIIRGNILMSNAKYTAVADKIGNDYHIKDITFGIDLNSDGDQNDVINGLSEASIEAIKCVER